MKQRVREIELSNVDTFTMGCTCFMGMAKPLQFKLQKKYSHKKIIVVDPGEVAFAIINQNSITTLQVTS